MISYTIRARLGHRIKDSWFDSNGNGIKYFNKYRDWKTGKNKPADLAKEYGEIYGVSMSTQVSIQLTDKKPMDWFYEPAILGRRHWAICVQQIIPLTTTTTSTSTTKFTTKKQECNQVILNGKDCCVTYIGRRNRIDGEKACQAINGTLPQPRSSSDVFNLLSVFLKSSPSFDAIPFYIDMFRTKKGRKVCISL